MRATLLARQIFSAFAASRLLHIRTGRDIVASIGTAIDTLCYRHLQVLPKAATSRQYSRCPGLLGLTRRLRPREKSIYYCFFITYQAGR